MASAKYEENSLPDAKGSATGLVDYPSSSDDENPVSHKKRRLGDPQLDAPLSDKALEDENPVSHEKQRLNDAPLDALLSDKGSSDYSDSDHEEEEGITFYRDNIVTDKYGEEQCYNTDSEFLEFGSVDYRAIDKWNLPEVYAVFVKGPRETPKCLELLDVIGCRNRFIGCSVELSRTFYAKLNKDEAARMEAVKGIRHLKRARDCVFDI
ncbi:uncharacterized protein LOC141639202 [Silene latifolia]|uniref:uncharacterized protein LOC141639202 n=1 Tax=Silene latifolia TaxID=37657 RepID=UPI003D775EE0